MTNRLMRLAHTVTVEQWWWMALLALGVAATYLAYGHPWIAACWVAGYALYLSLSVRLGRIEQRRVRYVGKHTRSV